MKPLNLLNYARDGWVQASGGLADVHSAVTGELIATTGSQGLDFRAMLDHGRNVGGPALRVLALLVMAVVGAGHDHVRSLARTHQPDLGPGLLLDEIGIA